MKRTSRTAPASSLADARLAWGAAVVLAAAGLFAGYLLEARAYPVNSDGSANALQAWDMLHGNVLLHGWWLSDVSFYTTELPQYALAETITGLRPSVIPVCAALTYTLLVLLVALVARGQARGREGVLRALLAGGIMAAPGLGFGSYAVLSSPDHTGTGVPVMVILLLLDRPDRARLRRYVPVLLLVLLVWVQVADAIAALAATVPIIAVGAIRAGVCVLRRRRSGWYDLQLGAAAIASLPVTAVVLAVLRSNGGFYLHPYPGPLLASPVAWPGQARILGHCLLTLFGAGTGDQPAALALLHLAGIVVAGLALLAGIGGFFTRLDRVSQILVVSVLVVLAAAQFSRAMTSILSVREVVTVLPASAALAGRLLGPVLARVRALTFAFGIVLAGYLGALGYSAAQPAAPAQSQALADWLLAHGLHAGLSGYWQASSVTLASRGRVQIAPIFGASPYTWESRSAWYDPAVFDPSFVVTVSSPPDEQMFARPVVIRRVFGPPDQVYQFGRYTILVFHRNLLTSLGVPPPLPPAATIAAP